MLAEYAYILKEGGIIYTATDVEELHLWMKSHISEHPLFVELTDEEMKNDPLTDYILNSTEEAKKVYRNDGQKYIALFKRIKDSLEN